MDALCGAAQGHALLESLFGAGGSGWSGGVGHGAVGAAAPRAAKAARIGEAANSAFARPAPPRVCLWELPWPALRRILLALSPLERLAVGAVCKPMLAASKHHEGACAEATRAPAGNLPPRCAPRAPCSRALRARVARLLSAAYAHCTRRGAARQRGGRACVACGARAHKQTLSRSFRAMTTLLARRCSRPPSPQRGRTSTSAPRPAAR
jgi:hypothetical protein